MVTAQHNPHAHWHSLWQTIRRHRKAIIFGALLIAVAALLLPHIAHAQPAAQPAPESADSVANSMLNGLSKILEVIKRIFWPILLMIGGLMQNDILFGAGMESRLNEIWVNVRNIVNILFVLVLVAIALINVMGISKDDYSLKTILPKFVIGLIAVNFTFVAAKIVLDGVNVISTAIFALPDAVQKSLNSGNQSGGTTTPGLLSVDEINQMCASIYGGTIGATGPDDIYINNVSAKATQSTGDQSSGDQAANQTICTTNPVGGGGPYAKAYLNPSLTNFFSTINAQNASLVLAINLQNATLLDKVDINAAIPKAGELVVNILFSIILFVVYGTAYIALFITLLVRLVALWVLIAISPLIVLPWVLPSLKEMLGEGGDTKKFIKTAIVPIPVALVMSIGFVMLQGLKLKNNLPTGTFNLNSNPTLNVGLYTSGVSTLGQLIGALGVTAFLWVGVFEAMKGTHADQITDSIKGAVQGAAKALGGFAVKSIPLFPTARGPATIGAISTAVHQIPTAMSQKEREEAARIFPEFLGAEEITRKIGTANNLNELKQNMGNISEGMFKDQGFQQQLQQYFEKHAPDQGQLGTWLKGTSYKKSAKEFMEELKRGAVDTTVMRELYTQMNITPAGGMPSAPMSSDELSKQQQAKADARGILGRKDELDKKNILSKDEAKKLEDDLKILDSKDPNMEGKKGEARERIAKITEKLKLLEETIPHDIAGTVSGFNPASAAQNVETLKGNVERQVKKIKDVTPGISDDDAKKQVLAIYGQKMKPAQKEALLAAATKDEDKKLIEAITIAAPAAPGLPPAAGTPPPPAAPPTTPPPTPPVQP